MTLKDAVATGLRIRNKNDKSRRWFSNPEELDMFVCSMKEALDDCWEVESVDHILPENTFLEVKKIRQTSAVICDHVTKEPFCYLEKIYLPGFFADQTVRIKINILQTEKKIK